MSGLRKLRVESLLMEQVGEIISRGRIKDPRLDGIIGVTEVSLSGDFKDAKVYVSIVDRDTGHEEDLGPRVRDRRAGVVKALNHAAATCRLLSRSRSDYVRPQDCTSCSTRPSSEAST
jgi:ribosome-binding factor A